MPFLKDLSSAGMVMWDGFGRVLHGILYGTTQFTTLPVDYQLPFWIPNLSRIPVPYLQVSNCITAEGYHITCLQFVSFSTISNLLDLSCGTPIELF